MKPIIKNVDKISDREIDIKFWDLRQLRVFYAIGFLIVGVLYPEDKTSIAGFHWPPLVLAIGLLLIVSLKRKLYSGIVKSGVAVLWVTLIFLLPLILTIADLNVVPSAETVLRHYLTLLITSVVSFLLVSDLSVSLILRGIYRFIFGLALALVVMRISVFDFSREGFFLGLGPLTFARYICIGWIAQIVCERRLRLFPSIIFLFSLTISDSKGPVLFLIFTLAIYLSVNSKRNWLRSAFLVICLLFLFVLSERFVAFSSDLVSFAASDLTIPNAVDFEAQVDAGEISGTVARIIALTSSIDFIAQRPLIGWGIGSWPSLTGLYYLEYPHNSFIELWFEYGIFGITVFLFFIGRAALGVFNNNPFSLFVIFCSSLSLVTGSIRDLRVLLFFILLTFHYMTLYKKPTYGARL